MSSRPGNGSTARSPGVAGRRAGARANVGVVRKQDAKRGGRVTKAASRRALSAAGADRRRRSEQKAGAGKGYGRNLQPQGGGHEDEDSALLAVDNTLASGGALASAIVELLEHNPLLEAGVPQWKLETLSRSMALVANRVQELQQVLEQATSSSPNGQQRGRRGSLRRVRVRRERYGAMAGSADDPREVRSALDNDTHLKVQGNNHTNGRRHSFSVISPSSSQDIADTDDVVVSVDPPPPDVPPPPPGVGRSLSLLTPSHPSMEDVDDHTPSPKSAPVATRKEPPTPPPPSLPPLPLPTTQSPPQPQGAARKRRGSTQSARSNHSDPVMSSASTTRRASLSAVSAPVSTGASSNTSSPMEDSLSSTSESRPLMGGPPRSMPPLLQRDSSLDLPTLPVPEDPATSSARKHTISGSRSAVFPSLSLRRQDKKDKQQGRGRRRSLAIPSPKSSAGSPQSAGAAVISSSATKRKRWGFFRRNRPNKSGDADHPVRWAAEEVKEVIAPGASVDDGGGSTVSSSSGDTLTLRADSGGVKADDVVAFSDASPVHLSGYLSKRSQTSFVGMRIWQKRFFVLREHSLAYYRDPSDLTSLSDLVQLRHVTHVMHDAHKNKGVRFRLCLSDQVGPSQTSVNMPTPGSKVPTPSSSGAPTSAAFQDLEMNGHRALNLAAESAEHAVLWTTAISTRCFLEQSERLSLQAPPRDPLLEDPDAPPEWRALVNKGPRRRAQLSRTTSLRAMLTGGTTKVRRGLSDAATPTKSSSSGASSSMGIELSKTRAPTLSNLSRTPRVKGSSTDFKAADLSLASQAMDASSIGGGSNSVDPLTSPLRHAFVQFLHISTLASTNPSLFQHLLGSRVLESQCSLLRFVLEIVLKPFSPAAPRRRKGSLTLDPFVGGSGVLSSAGARSTEVESTDDLKQPPPTAERVVSGFPGQASFQLPTRTRPPSRSVYLAPEDTKKKSQLGGRRSVFARLSQTTISGSPRVQEHDVSEVLQKSERSIRLWYALPPGVFYGNFERLVYEWCHSPACINAVRGILKVTSPVANAANTLAYKYALRILFVLLHGKCRKQPHSCVSASALHRRKNNKSMRRSFAMSASVPSSSQPRKSASVNFRSRGRMLPKTSMSASATPETGRRGQSKKAIKLLGVSEQEFHMEQANAARRREAAGTGSGGAHGSMDRMRRATVAETMSGAPSVSRIDSRRRLLPSSNSAISHSDVSGLPDSPDMVPHKKPLVSNSKKFSLGSLQSSTSDEDVSNFSSGLCVACARLEEQFSDHVAAYCSGTSCNVVVINALVTILITPFASMTTISDLSQRSVMNNPVLNPQAWRALFRALAGADIRLRAQALEDLNALFIGNAINRDLFLARPQWQSWVVPLIDGVDPSSTQLLEKQVYRFAMNIFALLHFRSFMGRRTFVHDLLTSLQYLQLECLNDEWALQHVQTALKSLLTVLNPSKKLFPPSFEAVPWANVTQLIQVVFRYLFMSPLLGRGITRTDMVADTDDSELTNGKHRGVSSSIASSTSLDSIVVSPAGDDDQSNRSTSIASTNPSDSSAGVATHSSGLLPPAAAYGLEAGLPYDRVVRFGDVIQSGVHFELVKRPSTLDTKFSCTDKELATHCHKWLKLLNVSQYQSTHGNLSQAEMDRIVKISQQTRLLSDSVDLMKCITAYIPPRQAAHVVDRFLQCANHAERSKVIEETKVQLRAGARRASVDSRVDNLFYVSVSFPSQYGVPLVASVEARLRMSVRDLVEQVKVQEKLDQAARYNVSVKGAGHKGVRRVSLDTKLSSMNLDSNSTIMLTVAQRSAS